MKGSDKHGARPVVVGANHRSSSLALRDRLFVEDSGVVPMLADLRAAGLGQAVLLSTCDRVEVQAVDDDPADAARAIREVFVDHAGLASDEVEGQLYTHEGDRAIEHIFCVAASLDSQVIGEPQVLGQVKAGHRLAREAGMVGSELEAIMQAAYGAAKKVRTETAVGEGPVSIAAASVELAGDVHGALDRVSALMIGVGDMGHLVAEHMLAAGLGHLTVTHPLESRAQGLSRTLDCHRIDFDRRADAMADADVVIAALGRRDYAVNADMVNAAIRARRRRPMFLVDVGVPGDVDPAVNRIDEAFVYDLNDLEQIASRGRVGREAEAEAGRRIVAQEVVGFIRDRAGRAAVPVVRMLRGRAEAIREEVLAEAGGDADRATQLLINRLLHEPSVNLRRAGAGAPGELEALESAVRALFDLGDGDADNGPQTEEET